MTDATLQRDPLRILIADDNVDHADSLAMLARLDGHEAKVAYSGEHALQLALESRPHLALLDIGLPKLSGHDLAIRLRSEPWGRRILLVAVTGWGQQEDKAAARAAGFDLHFTKPFDPALLSHLYQRSHEVFWASAS